jgi:predicted short-subunit dehydrogenase-like oxidoreductase (DUF2520 family)
MRISFIGSGNVATHLALALSGRGHDIVQVWSRDFFHARLLAERVEAQPVNDLSRVGKNADIYILAVSDNALYDLALDLHLGDALVLHTSGATPMEVLKPISTRYGVLWSPQTFVRDMAMEYDKLPFCIEGCNPKTESEIELLIGEVSPFIYHTNLQQRQYLHLSAVMVNNFTNCLYGLAQQLSLAHGIPFEILHPIIATTAQKVVWGDVRYQITGPAIRDDGKTIDAHRRLLAEDPQLLSLYDQLTALILTRMKFNEDD